MESTLSVKMIEAQLAIYTELRTTLRNIMQDVGNIPEKILEEIEKLDLKPTAPMIFEYTEADGELDTEMGLCIAVPIENPTKYEGEFKIGELSGMKCAEATYVGPIHDIGSKGHEPLIQNIMEAGLKFTDRCREVYTKWEGPDAVDNITEIQMEIE